MDSGTDPSPLTGDAALAAVEDVRRRCRLAGEPDPLDEAADLRIRHRGLGESWVDTGGFALRYDGGLDLAVNAFHACIGGVLAHWLFSPEDFDLDANAERMADAFIDTLKLSPALRLGYVPRPMAQLDDELSTLCEQACQKEAAGLDTSDLVP